MLGYRKYSFLRAHQLLCKLRENLEDLKTLQDLQKLLLREVVHAEERIRQYKSELREMAEPEATSNAKRVRYLTGRIERYRQCAYLWRSFGDAIAFLYLDRFSLKQCFYSTETTNPKHSAGFILGKEGLVNEVAILSAALRRGVPALLIDLTNTIKHGDVCLMGGSDPYLIEVKSSKAMNSRGKRQKRNIEKLHSFYETDEALDLRGFPHIQRRSYAEPEQTYIALLNQCICEAVDKGYSSCQPENGLHYVVTFHKGPTIETIISRLGLENAVWPFFLNEYKAKRVWEPYFPFVLSIESGNHLWEFIRGNILIFVFVELDAICNVALSNGCQSAFDFDNEDYPLGIENPNGGKIRVSSHMLTRIGLDFLSPRWIVRCSLERLHPESG